MIEIARYNDSHRIGAIDVILTIQQSEFAIPITLDAQPDLQDIENFYQRGDGNFWVAMDGEKVVATLGLLDIGNCEAALRKMFVSASHRGRKHGIAKCMLATLLAWCESRKLRKIYLGTTAKFLAAHRFYEKNEFVEIERDALPPSFPIMAVDTKFYCKVI